MRKTDGRIWNMIQGGELELDDDGKLWRVSRRRVSGLDFRNTPVERIIWMIANEKLIPAGYIVDFVDLGTEDLYHPDNIKLRLTMHEEARRRKRKLEERLSSIDDLLFGGTDA